MPTRPKTFNPRKGFAIPTRNHADAERKAFYNSARWLKLRRMFLVANPLCVDCLAADALTVATIAHHEEERLARPDLALDESNLTALCGSCHTKRHNTAVRPSESPHGPARTPGGGV